MKRRNNSKIFIIILILLISIGFAYLSQTLNINGAANIFGNSWKVIWDDTSINVVNGSVSSTTPTVDENKTTVTYNATLNNPGDYYEFSIDAYNQGTLDAMINLVTITYKENDTEITLPEGIKHTISYADGTEIAKKDLLKAGEKQKYYINIEYDRNVSESTVISTNRTISVTLKIDYEQADNTANEKVINNDTLCLNNKHLEITSNTVCKRATNLHTDKCLIEDESSGCRATNYNLNDEIIYGSCGTIGTLTAGDAFDCDVDGSGTYDEDERFYYVSQKDADENSDYATLIYYQNINTTAYNFDNVNYLGPVSILNKLPSTDEWNNITLTDNGVRQIKSYSGNNYVSQGGTTYEIPLFTYTGRAARLLTVKELSSACKSGYERGTGYLDNCIFLMEKTDFASIREKWWYLETPTHNYNTYVYAVDGVGRKLDCPNAFAQRGVRPAIEVPLKNIAY